MKKLFVSGILIAGYLFSNAQNVGIKTSSPQTSLDVNGSFSLKETALGLVNGDNNDINISDFSFFRISGPGTAFAITGIANGKDGREITLYNATSFALTIKNLNAASGASRRIRTLTGSDMIFNAGNASVKLQYSAIDSNWIVVSQQNQAQALLNQSAISVFGTTGLTVTSVTAFTLVPGLSSTINVPAGALVYASSTGGVTTTSALSTGFSQVDVALFADGSFLPNAGYQRVIAANTGGVTLITSYWSLAQVISLTPGSHTISVVAAGTGSGSNATVSSNSSGVIQGALTLMIIKQ